MKVRTVKGELITIESGPEAAVVCLRTEQLNVTQKVFAERLGVTVTAVARWEGGSREPEKWNYIQMLLMAKGPLRSYFETKVGRTREEILWDLQGEDHPARKELHIALDNLMLAGPEHLRQKVVEMLSAQDPSTSVPLSKPKPLLDSKRKLAWKVARQLGRLNPLDPKLKPGPGEGR